MAQVNSFSEYYLEHHEEYVQVTYPKTPPFSKNKKSLVLATLKWEHIKYQHVCEPVEPGYETQGSMTGVGRSFGDEGWGRMGHPPASATDALKLQICDTTPPTDPWFGKE